MNNKGRKWGLSTVGMYFKERKSVHIVDNNQKMA